METYELAIKVAVLIFPIIAFLITLPYMIKQYNKYGSIPFLRTIIVYSFVLYLLTAYFMVILPLPSIKEVSTLTSPWTQLIPFNFINDIKMHSSLVITDISTYITALKESVIYTNLFNLILTIPFGIYLRYYFNRKWWETILLSLLLSLFFEVTQISGLYGIYPRPYRLFDVDDLIINTTGGFLGHLITPLFSFILPSRKKLDEIAYEKGKKVSFARRALAFLIDCVTINVIAILLIFVFNIKIISSFYPMIYLLYFLLTTIIFQGKTFGKSIVKIKIVKNNGEKAKIHNILIRYTFTFIIFYQVYDIISWNKTNFLINPITTHITNIIYILLALVYFITILDIIFQKERFFYEKISNTKNISTIKIKEEKKETNEENNKELKEINEEIKNEEQN